ncbi:MAG: hypothetical protein WA173_07470 [Pseudomonas sp.]|uniref:spermidine synthase n=1 Tax=Pseudomonas sp. TaxID=306 RepID=UPI003BB5C937
MPDFQCRPEPAQREQIFCGQYYDDLSCTGFLGDPSKERITVLMLGLADGVAVAPIFANSRVASLLAVDSDETAIIRCLDNQKNLPAHFKFESAVADAAHFLATTADRYDVIIVDLYTQSAYASIVFDYAFHHLLKDRLNPLGHIVFNGFGIPMNLDPFNGLSPQAWLAQCLSESWSNINYLPHRRNATFIIGLPPLTTLCGADQLQSLSPSDLLFLEIMGLRLGYLIPAVKSNEAILPPPLDFVGIDLEMQKRWTKSLPALSEMLPESLELEKPSDLRALLDVPGACSALLDRLFEEVSPLRGTLAVLIAGEINFSNRDVSWFPEWVITKLENSAKINPRDWLEFLIPQAYAVITHRTNGDLSKVADLQRALRWHRLISR